METLKIMEILVSAIETGILSARQCEGFVGGFSSHHANFVIGDKEYVLNLREVADGEHWSQKVEE